MRKSIKSALAIVLALSCICMIAACGGGSTSSGAAPAASAETPASSAAPANNGQKYVLRMGNTAAYPAQPPWIMREFKRQIEEATDQIEVQLYEASAFGGPNEMIQGLQSGAMQAVLIPSGFYGSAAPDVGILDLPGLFANPEECTWVLNQDTPQLDAYFAQQGFVPIAWFYETNRDFLTLTPVHSLADFKGMNLRTYTVDVSQENIRAIGANPVIMGTADLPMALQQKTVDGTEAGVTMMAPAKYYDLAKYFVTELGAPLCNPCIMSKDFLDSLPEDLRELVVTTMHDICMGSGMDYALEYCAAAYQEMRDNGVEFTEADAQFKQDYLDATAYITTDFLAQRPHMQPVYDELQALIAEYRSANP